MRETINLINQAGKTNQTLGYGKHRHLGNFMGRAVKTIMSVAITAAAMDLLCRGAYAMLELGKKDNVRRIDRRTDIDYRDRRRAS